MRFKKRSLLVFFSGRDVFESEALISPSAILDFHLQHFVHSAPGSRMVGMVFYPLRNKKGVSKTQTSKTQTSDPKNSDPLGVSKTQTLMIKQI